MSISMIRKLGLCVALAAFSTLGFAGQDQGNGHGKGKSKHHDEDDQGEQSRYARPGSAVNVNIRFGQGDVRMIHDYYQPRLQQLPPGLQKKIARGGQLPPGWQKKMQPFPVELNARLAPVPVGCRRVVSGQVAMLIHDATNTVLDIIELAR